MKKLLSILLSTLMICALATPTFAATTVTTEGELQTALNAGGEVVLGNDIVATTKLTVPADSTVTLDLNGKTLSMEDSSSTTAALIYNQGNLTIKDSSNATGKITFATTTPDTSSVPSYASNTITNVGHLVVEGGTIENTSTSGGACYAIDTAYHSTEVSITINGGNIISTNNKAIRVVPYSTTAKSKLTINGGVISGSTAGVQIFNTSTTANLVEVVVNGGEIKGQYSLYTSNSGPASHAGTSIEINGGTFDGHLFIYNSKAGSSETDFANLSINGGEFKKETYIYTKDASGNTVNIPAITGGTFSSDVTNYVVDGYQQNENGEVVPIEPEQEEPTTPTITCAGSDDKNCDGVVTCDEVHGEGWDWNNTTKACEFFGTVKPNVYIVDTATK